MPINGLTIAADYGDRVHAGIEYVLASRIGFRAGIQKGLSNEKDMLIFPISRDITKI